MKKIIDMKEFDGYKQASDKQRKYIGKATIFDLELLPTVSMQREMEGYIYYRCSKLSLTSMANERRLYLKICRFLEGKTVLESFLNQEKKEWILQLKGWMLESCISLTSHVKSVNGPGYVGTSQLITYFEKFLTYLKSSKDERPENEKDIWELERLGLDIQLNPIKNCRLIDFKGIIQKAIREETKKGIYMHLKSEAVYTITQEMTIMRRLSRFLNQKYPQITSCKDIDREVIESFLAYLNTENLINSHTKSFLNRLRKLLETIGMIYHYPQLQNLILNREIPSTPRTEFKVYSDEELKRLNAALVKLDEQTVRLMIIHQMLGTRISDTLTLCRGCVYEKGEEKFIRIKQMKTNIYEKPVSKELADLIQKAEDYTQEHYGETKYIFVNDRDPIKAMQYATLRIRIIQLIHKENLKDDNGEYFGFGTHMYRHCYGMRLTEMHLDDWTIARLLGHNNLKNVRYYRRMSDQTLADETRAVRQMLSEIILANLDGWGEEYEQIRQNDRFK